MCGFVSWGEYSDRLKGLCLGTAVISPEVGIHPTRLLLQLPHLDVVDDPRVDCRLTDLPTATSDPEMRFRIFQAGGFSYGQTFGNESDFQITTEGNNCWSKKAFWRVPCCFWIE